MKQSEVVAYNKSVDVASMPDRVHRLPVSAEGWPVPWFVTWFKDGKVCADGEGVPDFRVVDPRKITMAIKKQKCWVCGEGPIGVYKCFVIGPMCSVNRIISEPPSHRDCAIFAARICPFLSRPAMLRNEKGMYDENGKFLFQEAGGIPLKRNPGAVCVWITKTYHPFNPQRGHPGVLFSLGRPVDVLWFSHGRRATRKEVLDAIESGYPTLEQIARDEGHEALAALSVQREVAMALVPVQ
jgi:hypothetical protein